MIHDPLWSDSDFVNITTSIERASSSRSRHRHRLLETESLENLHFPTSVEDSLRHIIRDFVREELRKLHSQSETTSTSSSIEDVIRDEIQQAMGLSLLLEQLRSLLW